MTDHKITIRERCFCGRVVEESSVEEVRDRLAGLLPEDALQDALDGLRPEEITGSGGR